MLLFVLMKVKLHRKVFSNGTGAISIMSVIKPCPSGLRCTADFSCCLALLVFLSLLQLLKCFASLKTILIISGWVLTLINRVTSLCPIGPVDFKEMKHGTI